MAAYYHPAVAVEQRSHVRGLVSAVLDEKHAVVHEYRRAVGRQRANCIEAIVPGGQRGLRLMLQVAERRVVAANVGGIGNDDVELTALDRLCPAAMRECDIALRQRPHVLTGDSQRIFAHVDSGDLAQWAFPGDGNRNSATAGAEVENLPLGFARNLPERQFNE